MSIVIAMLTEKLSESEDGKKFDMIKSEIWKLNSKLPDEIKSSKAIPDSCEFFNFLFYISQEE